MRYWTLKCQRRLAAASSVLLACGLAAAVMRVTSASAAGPSALFGVSPGLNTPLDQVDAAQAGVLQPGQTLESNAPSALGAGAEGSYLAAMDAWQGKLSDVMNVYQPYDDDANDAQVFGYELPQIWDFYHAVPMISFSDPGNPAGYSATGNLDDYYDVWATQLSQFIFDADSNGQLAPPGGRRVYIRWNFDANSGDYEYSPTYAGSKCAQLAAAEAGYVADWQHLYQLVMSTAAVNSTQVQWVFSVSATNAKVPQNCPGGASDLVRALYPGNQYVDWVALDGYSSPTAQPSAAAVFGPVVSELRSITDKPIAITEAAAATTTQGVGTGATTVHANPAQKGKWVAGLYTYARSAGIKMVLWYNQDTTSDWAVFSQPGPADDLSKGDCTYTYLEVTYNAYCEYRQGIGSSYFISPDTNDPRLLTNSQFQQG